MTHVSNFLASSGEHVFELPQHLGHVRHLRLLQGASISTLEGGFGLYLRLPCVVLPLLVWRETDGSHSRVATCVGVSLRLFQHPVHTGHPTLTSQPPEPLTEVDVRYFHSLVLLLVGKLEQIANVHLQCLDTLQWMFAAEQGVAELRTSCKSVTVCMAMISNAAVNACSRGVQGVPITTRTSPQRSWMSQNPACDYQCWSAP